MSQKNLKGNGAKCPAGRAGTADEVANVAELLMSEKGAFITGTDFLCDGGAAAGYFYGPLRPDKGEDQGFYVLRNVEYDLQEKRRTIWQN